MRPQGLIGIAREKPSAVNDMSVALALAILGEFFNVTAPELDAAVDETVTFIVGRRFQRRRWDSHPCVDNCVLRDSVRVL